MNRQDLHSRYAPLKNQSLSELYESIKRKRLNSLSIVMQTGLAGLLVETGLYIKNYASISNEVKEAFRLAFPNMELTDLAGKSVEYLDGIEQGWKGKLFEVMVTQKLNKGETVGGITLNNGEIAQLATSPTQTEWDLQILDNGRNPIEYLQLKATENHSYITATLEKYPTTQILTTSEIGNYDR